MQQKPLTPDATVKEAALLLGVDNREVYSLCKKGAIPHYKYGKSNSRLRFVKAEIEKFLAESRSEVKR